MTNLAAVSVARSVPADVDLVAVGVAASGSVPRQLGLNRSALATYGFEGKIGQTLIVPTSDGPAMLAVGTGDGLAVDQLRDAGAAVVRNAGTRASVATTLLASAAEGVSPVDGAQALAEGIVLAGYRYADYKNDPAAASPLESATIVASGKSAKAAEEGVARGTAIAAAACLARDLANTPPAFMNARDIAARAVELAGESKLQVEVYDKDQLTEMGCGGILGVNRGSTEPPRMVKLTYTPRNPKAHVALVGKGVMYDSGGLSLKSTNPMSVLMKMDMSGAAAVLSTMTALAAVGCRNKVSAWLMCTDNMPSGSALKLGDVLTMRNGKTVEIHNTDAEGRLVMADGLSLAVEEQPDAIVDIATLTGAAVAALGDQYAAVVGSDQRVVDALLASSATTDEGLWQLPLSRDQYRSKLDSVVADMKNVGGPYAGTITAAIFLSEFSEGVPWGHLDIAGPMNSDADNGWLSKGATGYGTRLLIDFACSYQP